MSNPIAAAAESKGQIDATSGLHPDTSGKPRSLGRDAWSELVRRPLFIISLVLITIFLLMAIVPRLFTAKDPRTCDLALSRLPPSSEAWFGYDNLGCDVYANTIYGARSSMTVGLVTTIMVVLVGGFLGMLAGFYGGRTDTLLSRTADVFFGIPFFLGALLVLTTFPSEADTPAWQTIGKVVLALTILGWPTFLRLMRASVIQVRGSDFVEAARSLGAPNSRLLRRHVLPNSLSAVIVVATLSLGGYIIAEATLSFLGIGLQPPVISWGAQISEAVPFLRVAPFMLFFPALFLSICVLSFMMLGDAVKDALDPKLR
jgi:oligopeptide transport system permease protein